MTQPLTDTIIKQLPPAEKINKVYFDDAVAGFGVRVTATGAKSFILNYRVRGTGRERRFTIGGFPNWTTGAARQEARRLRQLIDRGGDPLADLEQQRAAPTVADLIKRFEEEHLPRKRPETVRSYRGMLHRHIGPHFGAHTRVADVAFEDVDALHRKITKTGTPYEANRVVALLSKMFALAIRWKMRADNPAQGVEHNPEAGRQRYMKPDELAGLIEALAKYPDRQTTDIIRLLMLTGARRGEVMAMRWDDIDFTGGSWNEPSSTTKQKKRHSIPLSAPVHQLLSEIADKQKKPLGTYVFPSVGRTGHVVDISRAWRQLCAAAGITGLRVHDLRHSFASELVSGGASLPLIGALLGHSNPRTTARYAHLFDDPQRAAVEKVAAIYGAAGKEANNVIPIKPGRKHV
jgi:integrase